ncbi:hypothetical protein AtEden1_Chr3g0217921 [Arabidopsis thaliana]
MWDSSTSSFIAASALIAFNTRMVLTYFFISIPHVLMCVIYSSSCIFTAYNTDLDRSRRYCSSYYKEQADPIKICDWCQCETKSRTGAKHGVNGGSSKRSYRSEYSSPHHQIKQQEINQTTSSSIPPAADKGKTGVPSPRPATRRYKLLKDVMC